MVDESSLYEKALREYLSDEFRVLNAHLPRSKKSLAVLLHEEHPLVECSDGSAHFFKKKELNYLAGLLTTDEQQLLTLPILLELTSGRNEVRILGNWDIEGKVVSEILRMPLTHEHEKMIIYKSQLGELRNALRTTTQYVFSPQSLK